ncbi:MAG: hypothetical protein ACLFTE_09160 [Salinivenus sp.]
MFTTTAQRRASSSALAPGILVLGLMILSVAPLSCGTEGDDASDPEADQTTEATSDRAILLNIGVEDKTENDSLTDAFTIVTPSETRWTPGPLKEGGATKEFEKHPVGETRTLRLYPEGEEGRALEVPITMKADMSSALASSRTEIFVYDDSIVVSGPAVPDEDTTLDRPSSETP